MQQQQAQPGMYQAPPPPVPRSQIVTLRYQGGPPPPHPPVTDPTPDEEYQMGEAQRQAQQAQNEQARAAQNAVAAPVAQSTGKGGFFKVVSLATGVVGKVGNVVSDVHSMGEEKVRALIQQQALERFQKNFPELAQVGDVFIVDYSCKVMSQGNKFSGHLQITNRHLCWTSDTLKDIIPLQEIASIQRSIALETVDNGPPYIMPVPAPHVRPDTLQLFTTQAKVFQFLEFESTVGKAGAILTSTIKGKPIDRCYNFMDHAWRAAVPVPLPGIQYAQY